MAAIWETRITGPKRTLNTRLSLEEKSAICLIFNSSPMVQVLFQLYLQSVFVCLEVFL